MRHQAEALAKGKDREFFGYIMDPGTGKTRVGLKDAWHNYEQGRIDALVVLAPNGPKTSWVSWDHWLEPGDDPDQVETHLGQHKARIIKGVWTSSAHGEDKKSWADFEKRLNAPHQKFIVLAVNYEALLSEGVYEFLKEFVKQFRTMLLADESTRIGKPGSKRTKRATALAKFATLRRIMTGTPVKKSPMKIYSQAKFLSPSALGYTSFYPFRNRYAILGGFRGKEVLDYQNLDELGDKIAEWTYRAAKKDCLDLPEQVWLKRRVYMTKEQAKAYQTMREEFFAEVDGTEITAPVVIAQMTRLQQILGGYLKKDGKVFEIIPPERNPKILEALSIIEGAPGQVVMWHRFRPELEALAYMLHLKKISFFQFHGDVPDGERVQIRKAFKRGDRQVILGTASTGGIGIDEFKVADVVGFVSNDFDTEKRVQAEDRNHRIGSEMHKKITYYDILVPNTVDMKIIRVMRGDAILSAKVLKEDYRAWI